MGAFFERFFGRLFGCALGMGRGGRIGALQNGRPAEALMVGDVSRVSRIGSTVMTTSAKAGGTDDASDGRALIGIGRGFGGALIFALPMLMTMEMWELGFYIAPGRLLLLLLLVIPLLAVLSPPVGFEPPLRWRQAFRAAALAFGLGIDRHSVE